MSKEVEGKVVGGSPKKRKGCCDDTPDTPPNPLKFHLTPWNPKCGRSLDLDRLQIGASDESEDDPELEAVRERYAADAELRAPGCPLAKVKPLDAEDVKDPKSGDAQL